MLQIFSNFTLHRCNILSSFIEWYVYNTYRNSSFVTIILFKVCRQQHRNKTSERQTLHERNSSTTLTLAYLLRISTCTVTKQFAITLALLIPMFTLAKVSLHHLLKTVGIDIVKTMLTLAKVSLHHLLKTVDIDIVKTMLPIKHIQHF